MRSEVGALLLVAGLSAVGVLGDYLLKRASAAESPFGTWHFVLGLLVYSSTACGWVLAMQRLKLATIGAVYCVSTVLLLAIAGLLVGERLSGSEVAGIALAVSSLCLLARTL